MKSYPRLIDTQTAGTEPAEVASPRCDATPLLAALAAFAQLIADLSEPFAAVSLYYVAAIDALGFVLGGRWPRVWARVSSPSASAGQSQRPLHSLAAAC